MIDHPRLADTEADEPAIELTLEPADAPTFAQPSRETFVLSTRATGLVLGDLGYAEREEVASVTVRTLLLTGGAYRRGERIDPVDTVQRLTAPNGGKHPTDDEIERVAAYLKDSEVGNRVRWLVEELVTETRLSEVMTTAEIRTQRERTNGLRGIAKDL